MKLYDEINYIVSGLERSGTSMIMQMLNSANIPCAYDDGSRPPDTHNPRGYFELAGGKIINKLMASSFPMDVYRGRFIKVTAYGLQFLPEGRYSIIYVTRNIEEILDSQEAMTGNLSSRNRDRELLEKIQDRAVKTITGNSKIRCLNIWYRNVIAFPLSTACEICEFLDLGYDTQKLMAMVNTVDPKLYRNRRGRQ